MSLVSFVFRQVRSLRDMRVLSGEFVARLRGRLHGLANPYRPEFHYMRGPGPKWREKNGHASATASSTRGASAQR
jgi:hypothetical protein